MINRYLLPVSLAIALVACESAEPDPGTGGSSSTGSANGGTGGGVHVGECMTNKDCETACAEYTCSFANPGSPGTCAYSNVLTDGTACRLSKYNNGACVAAACQPIHCATDDACAKYTINFCLPSTCGSDGVCANAPKCAAAETCDRDQMMCFAGTCGTLTGFCGGPDDISCCPGYQCLAGICQP